MPCILALSFACNAIAVEATGAPQPPRPLLITVDDLPIASRQQDPAERERITRELLAVLAKHRIQAVGLVTWKRLREPSETRLLDQWLAAGHELGNHTFGHLDYTTTDSTTWIADAERGRKELAGYLGKKGRKLRFFRFPYLREGDTPEKLAAARRWLARTGQRNLVVTIDDQDWSYDAGWMEARARSDRAALDSIGAAYQSALQLEVQTHEARGDDLFERTTPQILLLHANDVGTGQWDRLFTWLAGSGHRFATADEVLADSAFSVAHAYVGPSGPGLWDRLADDRRRTLARAGVERFFSESASAWNRGDLDAFCSHYAEDAFFVSPNGETRGRDKVLERYKKRYGTDPASMGKLSFEIVELRLSAGTEITMLGGTRPAAIQTASAVARWKLVYPDKESSGLTLLVLRPASGGKWQVVQDASF